MTEHRFTQAISKRTISIEINSIRLPLYEKTFFNKSTGKKFEKNDVEIMTYKRNKIFIEYFKFFASNSSYSMIEIGFDFKTSHRVSDILLKLKRQLKKLDVTILGYCWLVDKGDMGTMHFHLVVTIPKLDVKGKSLPNELKITFNEKKVHSSFVRNKPKLRDYLLRKEIYYIGKRKRVYGKSRFFYKNAPKVKNAIQRKLTHTASTHLLPNQNQINQL